MVPIAELDFCFFMLNLVYSTYRGRGEGRNYHVWSFKSLAHNDFIPQLDKTL